MNGGNGRGSEACTRARGLAQERLDGPLSAALLESLERHLERCADCRAHAAGLRDVREALRSLPGREFPEADLEQVWSRTVHATGWRPRPGPRRLVWRGLAAAAALAVVLLGLWAVVRDVPDVADVADVGGPTSLEAADAAEQTRLVLALAAGALRKTERAAIDGVLAGEVAPALKKIPVRLPGTGPRAERRTGT